MMDTIAVQFRPHAGGQGGVIKLASHTPSEFLNIVTRDFDGSTVHPADAKALRDALNEIYPLEFATAAEPSQYWVRR